MKTYQLVIAACLLMLAAACTRIEDKAIAGIYSTSFRNEFSRTEDTLVITAYNLAAHTYTVERYSGYHKIRNGQELPKEFKRQHWMATYRKSDQVLEEGELGRKLYLKPAEQELVMGVTHYHLIK